jgi:hypothetical protein
MVMIHSAESTLSLKRFKLGAIMAKNKKGFSKEPFYSKERSIDRNEVESVYTQMYKDEIRNDERAFERTRKIGGEFYGGLDPRRRQEAADSGMIREDHRAIANLSPEPIHHEFPKEEYYSNPYIDSLVRKKNDSNY